MARDRDTHAIALGAAADANEPLPEFPALPPAALPLNLPSVPSMSSLLLPMPTAADGLDDIAPVLALCPSVLPMAFSQVLDPDDSVHRWLTSTLPLVLAPWVNEALAVPVSPVVIPVVAEAAPVVQKSRKSKATDTKTEKTLTDKTPRKRSPKTPTAAAAQLQLGGCPRHTVEGTHRL